MIFEGVIATRDAAGAPHLAPMGFRREGARLSVAPYVPSATLDNLRGDGRAVMNLVDDVRVIAGCLTGRREWPVQPATRIAGWRLAECLGHLELEVRVVDDHPERPRFHCDIVHHAEHAPFAGFNRAQAAVLEAAILHSRLDWLAPEKLRDEMRYLAIAVDKTAGPREREAWDWLLAAMAAHPRHRLRLTSS